jgi:hypothetical protein
MLSIDIESWEAFEERLQQIRQAERANGRRTDFLFRGVCDSTCELTTTLERTAPGFGRISDYYYTISRLKPQIESLTGNSWEVPDPFDVKQLLESYDAWSLRKFPDRATYSYMIHLRHHGFPSPLLDWTRSHYIAAFFAFRSDRKPTAQRVSIYVFSEMPEVAKLTSSDRPWIRRTGPFVTTHRRHFLQQCDYTMCATFSDSKEWRFACHEDVTGGTDQKQDVLWKLNVPWTERLKVLGLLDNYNMNAFTLFESEEALMETLAVRAIELRSADSDQE